MEITCPNCQFSRDVSEDKLPPNAAVATCPQCRHKFMFRDLPDGEEFVFEETDDQADATAHNANTATVIDVPWERMDKYGFFGGLFQTIKRAMFAAPMFFRTMPTSGKFSKPLGFAVLTMLFGAITAFILESEFGLNHMFMGDLTPNVQGVSPQATLTPLFFICYSVLLVPGLFFSAGCIHGLLRILGAADSGYRGTFRAVCYGSAPQVLAAIPFAGQLVGGIWSLVISIIALKHIHRTSYTRVLLTFPLALLLVFLLGTVVAGCGALLS